MAAHSRGDSRGIAVAAFVVEGVWAGLTILLGAIAMVVERWGMPGSPQPFEGSTWMNLAFALFVLWILSLNGVLAAAILGAVALHRAKAGVLRLLAFVGLAFGGPIFALWWGNNVSADDATFPDHHSHTMNGLGLIVIAAVVLAVSWWLLKQSFRGAPLMPPPDPSALLYSDSTT